MADKILSVQTLTATAGGTEIPLPEITLSGTGLNGFQKSLIRDAIVYQFNTLHSGAIELVQNPGDTEGLEIEASTAVTSGPWRLISDPPKFLYSAKAGGEPCRVTIILIK